MSAAFLRDLAVSGLMIPLGVALALPTAGCEVYDASLVDAGTDSGPAPDAGPCNSRRPPARPDGPDEGGDEELLFGLRAVELEQEDGERWREIGHDLDGHCTQPPIFGTECIPPRRSQAPPDGDDGIDNVFGGQLFPLIDLAVSGLQPLARQAQDEGKLPVVRIRGWNGLDDDPRVDVAITNAIYVVPDNGAGAPMEHTIVDFEPFEPDGSTRLPFPRWDGTDFGYFREATFLGGDLDQPILRDDNAYISGRFVVARLPARVEILFPAMDVGVLVRLTDATAVGHISDDGLTLEDTIVSGRWSVVDLLSTAENVGICRGTSSYDILAGQLDTAADVRSQPGSGGPGVRCDAVSLGVRFTGSRLLTGGLTVGRAVRNVCTEVPRDAGLSDAGPPDASSGFAGPPDASSGFAGPPDAGSGFAGPRDAGPSDAG